MALLTAFKTSTQNKTNDTTLALDTDLQVTLLANTTYTIEAYIGMTSSGAGAGRFRFATPSSPSRSLYACIALNSGTTPGAMGPPLQDDAVALSSITTFSGTSFDENRVLVCGLITTGGSGGTFGLEWSQAASSANVTQLFLGSYLLLSEV